MADWEDVLGAVVAAVELEEPELDEPEFDDPELEALEDPALVWVVAAREAPADEVVRAAVAVPGTSRATITPSTAAAPVAMTAMARAVLRVRVAATRGDSGEAAADARRRRST